MNSRRLLDPELIPLAEAFPDAAAPMPTLAEIRGRPWRFPPLSNPEITKTIVSVPGTSGDGGVLLSIYRPRAARGPLGCVFHIHGGGFIAGSVERSEHAFEPIITALGCAVASIEYRLAPETVFPGAIEDCYTGIAWLFANAAQQGIDASRIGIKGESAGGGLAAALALLVRDRGEFAPLFQHLMYPMLDDRTGGDGDQCPYAGQFVWTPALNRFGWGALLGHPPGGKEVSPYAAAARAEDLAGLPQTYMAVGALDLFVGECMTYADRLIRAGVPTELHVYPGACHAFDLSPDPAISLRARRDSLAALQRFLA